MKASFGAALIVGLMITACGLGGCSTLAQIAGGVSGVAGKLAGPVPGQAATYGDAVQLADLATKATKIAIDSVHLTRAQLVQLSALNDSLHAAVVSLKQANDSGGSLDFAAFNAALAAWNTYAGQIGVPKPPAS